MASEIGQLCKALESQGWSVVVRRGGHLKLTAPSGAFYFCAATPSDHRAVKNIRSACKKLGAIL